jgi:hypothetical protein
VGWFCSVKQFLFAPWKQVTRRENVSKSSVLHYSIRLPYSPTKVWEFSRRPLLQYMSTGRIVSQFPLKMETAVFRNIRSNTTSSARNIIRVAVSGSLPMLLSATRKWNHLQYKAVTQETRKSVTTKSLTGFQVWKQSIPIWTAVYLHVRSTATCWLVASYVV